MFPRKRTLAGPLAAWLALVSLACESSPRGPAAGGHPEVTPIDLASYQQRLGEERGHVVVVNFWATWCEPCREEFPDLIEFDHRYAERGVRMLSVSLDDPELLETAVRDFLAEQNPPFPTFIKSSDDDPDIFINALDPEWSGALPATLIYDRAGRRRASLVGKQTLASLQQHVEPLL